MTQWEFGYWVLAAVSAVLVWAAVFTHSGWEWIAFSTVLMWFNLYRAMLLRTERLRFAAHSPEEPK